MHSQVRVPVANTLGKIGNGMQVILSNFNHERWMVVATSIPAQRLIVEECLKSVINSVWIELHAKWLVFSPKVVNTAYRLWQAIEFTSRDSS